MRGNVIPLSLKMAWRETRGSWRRFVFFVACLAIGVGAVVGIELFAATVEGVILKDARSLLGGDVEIRSARELGEDGQTVLASLNARHMAMTHVWELVGMAAAARARTFNDGGPERLASRTTQLVELKAVESNYPLYGRVGVSPDQPLHTLLSPVSSCPDAPVPVPCFGLVVQESLLIVLGLDMGAHLKIGQAWFEVRGVLQKEPDRMASAFSLGPRVMMSRDALVATDLVQVGSRVRHRYLLRVPESLALEPLLGELRGRLVNEGAGVSSFRTAQPRIRGFLDQFTIYLGLIALAALFVGGIGIACTIHGFIAHKLTTVAILKTLGADAGLIMRVYMGQSGLMGCVGSLIGVIVGMGLQLGLSLGLSGMLPVADSATVTVMPLVKGLLLGMGTTLCFTLWPLLTIRTIPPALVFRREVEPVAMPAHGQPFWQHVGRSLMRVCQDRHRCLTGAVIGAGLLLLAVWQARSVSLGAVFLLAFGAALVLLRAGVWLLLHMVRRVPRSRSFVVRHALGRVQRPGHYTVGMTVAIGVGVMVITTVAFVKVSMLSAIGDRLPDDAPTFFFVDIQPDQKQQFEHIMRTHMRTGTYDMTPVVRSRLGSLNGTSVNPEDHAGRRNGWYFTREYVLTASADLPKDNTIVKGSWWSHPRRDTGRRHARGAAAGVSVEEEAARNLGLDVGSTVEFDVQGVLLSAVVENIRKVDWGSFSTNFYMMLSPAALDGAPLTYLSPARVSPEEAMPLQQALVRALPNVTAIPIGDVLANVARLLEQLARVIQGIALFNIFSGAVVMMAALSSTRYRRLYEFAVLKVMGCTRRAMVQSFAIECAVVGTLAGLIGVGLASALSWAILYFFLDLPWVWQPVVMIQGLAATVGLAVVVGFFSAYRILGQSPLAVLRQE